MRNQVQLIAYADRFGATIGGLTTLLDGPLRGLFGAVHVLPFFHPYDGVDAGFDPIDHTQVDVRLGDWDDVRELAKRYDVIADLIVNHVSTESPYFDDVRRHGEASLYAPMFLTFDRVFPAGASEEQLLRIYRPRPGLPFTRMRLGEREHLVWTTFTDRQVDIDVHSAEGSRYLTSVLHALAEGGIRTIRVDAVGYAVKTAGTSCFMTPQTLAFVDEITARAHGLGLEVLVEVHGTHEQQLTVAEHVDWIYDFALPPLVLHALVAADADPLRRWLDLRPANVLTVLDTHDGIGVVDVAGTPDRPGLLAAEQISALVETIHRNSGGTSRQATGAAASNLDTYQVNCTYYDSLGRDGSRYLLARALQLFVPGVPQIYYVGLLAGSNDLSLLAATGVGREVNRHRYEPDEIAVALQQPVVTRLLKLIAFRNAHPAFAGTFAHDGERGYISLQWRNGTAEATLRADLAAATYQVRFSHDGDVRTIGDFADLPRGSDATG